MEIREYLMQKSGKTQAILSEAEWENPDEARPVIDWIHPFVNGRPKYRLRLPQSHFSEAMDSALAQDFKYLFHFNVE